MALLSPSQIDTTLLQDGQTSNSITPSRMRQVVDSLTGVVVNLQTASYTVALTDVGTVIEINSASPTNFTVPTHGGVPFNQYAVFGLRQVGAGLVSIVAAGGVTLHFGPSFTTMGQWVTVYFHQRNQDEWVVA